MTSLDAIKQDIDDAAEECAQALKRGPARLVQLVALKSKQGSVPTRVRYVLGGIRAMGTVDPVRLKQYFDALWERTDKVEEAAHVQAMEIILEQLKRTILLQTTAQLQAIAVAMRLDYQIEIVATGVDDEEDDDDEAPPVGADGNPLVH